MRTEHLNVENVQAQVSGGWVGPDAVHRRMPRTRSVDGSVDVRLDDGRVISGIPGDGMRAGDRIYHVLYQGHLMKDHYGLDLVNGTTATRVTKALPAMAERTWAFHVMASVPIVILCLIIGFRLGGTTSFVLDMAMLAMSPGVLFPLAMGIYHDRRRRKVDTKARRSLEACRIEVQRVIATDIASWKAALATAVPDARTRRAVHVHGTAYLLIEGTILITRSGPIFVATGHASELPPSAAAACSFKHGDLAHMLISADLVDAPPIAVSNPGTARTWMEMGTFAGKLGRPYRLAIRSAFGRAAWRAVAREGDELSRRREKTKLRA